MARKKAARKMARSKKKAAEQKPRKRGRPRQEFDLGLLAFHAERAASYAEIADALGTSEQTVRERLRVGGPYYDEDFHRVYRVHRNQRLMTLRDWQWKAAEGGHVGMLIWLGKQYLGQRDKPEEHLEDQDAPSTFEIILDPKGEANLAKYKERHLRLVNAEEDEDDEDISLGGQGPLND